VGKLVDGDIVVIAFPFSDHSATKKRPALVVGLAEFDDVILCQITSQPYASIRAIPLKNTEIVDGILTRLSYIRPDKLFTTDVSIVLARIGRLKRSKISEVLINLRQTFTL